MKEKLYTVVVWKPKNVRTTVVGHSTRTPEGGEFGTSDAGWSLKRAVAYEIGRLPDGARYQVEVNDKIVQEAQTHYHRV